MKQTHTTIPGASRRLTAPRSRYSGNTAGNTRNSRIDYIYYSHSASNLALKSSQVSRHAWMRTASCRPITEPLMSVFTVK